MSKKGSCFSQQTPVFQTKTCGNLTFGIVSPLSLVSLDLEIGHTSYNTIAMISYRISAIREYKYITGYVQIYKCLFKENLDLTRPGSTSFTKCLKELYRNQ